MARAPQSASDIKQDGPSLLDREVKQDRQPLPVPQQVTYLGGTEETTFMQHKFIARVPREVKDSKLIEIARDHRYFKVGDFDPNKDILQTEMIGPPKTAEAYRRWAIEWMKKLENVEDGCQRWATEARMRLQLEVGFDDYKYISDFFQPILSELIKRDDDPRGTRDKITDKGEFADLFLQINRVAAA